MNLAGARALAGVRRRARGASPACRPATATAARSSWRPTATTPRSCAACTSSSASLGLEAEWLTPSRCRALEPGLSPRIAGGILAPAGRAGRPARDRARAGRRRSSELELGVEVDAIEHDGGRVTGVRTSGGHDRVRAGRGRRRRLERRARARRRRAARAPGEGPDPRAARARRDARAVRARACARRAATWSARGDGRVVLGATVEEQGFDTTVTADGVFRLLEAAWEVLPEVGELELVGARAGLRPGTPDNAPVVGRRRARRPRSGPPATGATACCSPR